MFCNDVFRNSPNAIPHASLGVGVKGRKADVKTIHEMTAPTVDQEFLEYLIKSLVDHPDDVKVERKVDDMGVLLSLRVHPMDMGQIVGRQGTTAKAIRSLLRIVGIKNHAHVNLKIEEPEGSTRGRRPMEGANEQ